MVLNTVLCVRMNVIDFVLPCLLNDCFVYIENCVLDVMQVSYHSSSSSDAPIIIILPYLKQPSAMWGISVCNYSITLTGAVRHAACITHILLGEAKTLLMMWVHLILNTVCTENEQTYKGTL